MVVQRAASGERDNVAVVRIGREVRGHVHEGFVELGYQVIRANGGGNVILIGKADVIDIASCVDQSDDDVSGGVVSGEKTTDRGDVSIGKGGGDMGDGRWLLCVEGNVLGIAGRIYGYDMAEVITG